MYNKIKTRSKQTLIEQAHSIKTIDMHTGGEPLRVVVDGWPVIKGNTILEKRQYIKKHHDHLRRALMLEPRGHADMYGCLLTQPNNSEAEFGILFMHNEGYSTMCGHAIIAISKLAVEMGWVEQTEPLTKMLIDAPCGRIKAYARVEKGKVIVSNFDCVPSFVVALDQKVNVPGFGIIEYDLAFGGAFYAYVNAGRYDISMKKENYQNLIRAGMAIKKTVMKSGTSIKHPFEKDLGFLYGTIFTGKAHTQGVDSRNVCIFADGEVDRSPTGSGVAGRMAIHYKRGELKIGQSMYIESITGSVFKGSIVETKNFGPFSAVIPRVEGTAYITGRHEFIIDPDDPFKDGFMLR